MKKNVAISIISVLSVLALVFCILYFTNNANKQKEIDTLTADVTEKASQIETLSADVAGKTKEIETLNADVADKEGQITTLSADVADKEGKIDALTADVADKSGKIDALTADVADKSGQIDALTADVADKSGQIETLTADVADKSGKIDALTADVADKSGKIDALTADVADKSGQIDALTADVADKSGQIDKLTADVADKSGQIEKLSADVAGKSEQIADLNARAAESDKELEGLRADNESKDGQIRSLTEEVQSKDEMIATLKEQNEEKDQMLRELQTPGEAEPTPVPIYPQDSSESGSSKAKDVIKAAVEGTKEEIKEAAGELKTIVAEKKEEIKEAAAEVRAVVEEKKEEVKEAVKEVKAAVAEKTEKIKTAAFEGLASKMLPKIPQLAPFTLKGKVTLNKQTLGMFGAMLLGGDQARIEKLNQLIDFENNLEYTLVYDGANAEETISLKGEELASFLALKDGSSLKFYSDLFPGYCFAVGEEDLAGMTSETDVNVDPTKMAAAFAGPMMKVMSGLKFGKAETVEEPMFGAVFTSRTPLNMTLKEMGVLGLSALRDMMANKEVAKLLDGLKGKGVNLNFTAESIDEAIKAVEASDEAELPALDAAIFSNADNDVVFRVDIAQDGQTVSRSVGGKVGNDGVSEVQIGDQMYVYVRAGRDGVNIIIRPKGTEISFNVVPERRENGTAFVATLSVMKMELAKIELEKSNEAALTGRFETEGKKEITFRELTERKGSLLTELKNDAVSNYLPALREKIQKAAPEMMPIFSGLKRLIRNLPQMMPMQMIPGF